MQTASEERFWGASHAWFHDLGTNEVNVFTLRQFITLYTYGFVHLLYMSINVSSIKCVFNKYKNTEMLK